MTVSPAFRRFASLVILVTLPASKDRKSVLPSLDRALQCAALAEAEADRLEGSDEGSQRFDEAMFWGMAASEVARKEKRSSKWFTEQQERRRAGAKAALSDLSGPAHLEVKSCSKEVPKRGTVEN